MAYGTVLADVVQSSVSGVSLGAGNASIMKNRIINGAMVIDQRNAGASKSVDNTYIYTLDRWAAEDGSDGVFTIQQDTTAPTGFINSLKFTTTTADSSLASNQYAYIEQNIEGYNVADLGYGTANALTTTLSFWVRSSLTGTFGGAFVNAAASRSYAFTYTISAANTWEQKSITVAGDTTGTWVTNNSVGLKIRFGLGVGTGYSGTAGSWAAANYISATGATSVIGTLSATWYVSGVQLEVGSSATGFEYRQYSQELVLCQRYACSTFPIGTAWAQNSGANGGVMTFYQPVYGGISAFFYPVQMRAAPTVTFYNPSGANSNWYLNNAATESSGTYGISTTSVGTLITTVGNATNQYARVHLSASAEL
jgi:hypothetical protein